MGHHAFGILHTHLESLQHKCLRFCDRGSAVLMKETYSRVDLNQRLLYELSLAFNFFPLELQFASQVENVELYHQYFRV